MAARSCLALLRAIGCQDRPRFGFFLCAVAGLVGVDASHGGDGARAPFAVVGPSRIIHRLRACGASAWAEARASRHTADVFVATAPAAQGSFPAGSRHQLGPMVRVERGAVQRHLHRGFQVDPASRGRGPRRRDGSPRDRSARLAVPGNQHVPALRGLPCPAPMLASAWRDAARSIESWAGPISTTCNGDVIRGAVFSPIRRHRVPGVCALDRNCGRTAFGA